MAYLLLACAIATEVAATSLLPRTAGFTVLLPSLAVVAGYALSFVLLSQVVKTVPVAVAYAIWSAAGTAAVAAIGATFLGQPLSPWQVAGLALVITGVVLLQLGGATH
ncbi:DMT family transporter [Modestobacter versicolor]|uniref:QacE family quaternary ammonium compound efflux SMR transporter n=1 Tax=Modestobacter versicolor TaxID=429133 RepID=A0A323V9D4_9ACTN|nr:multidrug efflux SMR transporter [Modestobacter versicolor]MBB3677284.1 small multidrug resistance pump [Modestobacter versicolor]PZA21457.1 QacE family quaternary ammonium compound efflux SMR transporter [Modestobacter versicolor]